MTKTKSTILSKLAALNNEKVNDYLITYSSELRKKIRKSKNNEDIYFNLELIEQIAHQVPETTVQIVSDIISKKQNLVSSKTIEGLGKVKGKSHKNLVYQCIELLDRIRYLKIKEVIVLLIRLSKYRDAEISRKAKDVLIQLGAYDRLALENMGYFTQKIFLNYIVKFNKKSLQANWGVLLDVLQELLKPTFEGHAVESYRTVTLYSGSLHANEELIEIRNKSIQLLKKMYFIENRLKRKKSVLKVLQEASQVPFKKEYSKELKLLIIANTNKLLEFYMEIFPDAEMEIKKDIEEHKNWCISIFSKNRLNSIDKLELIIGSDEDYMLYRIFVGYDGRFSNDLGWKEASELRNKEIQRMIGEITKENFSDWQKKILSIIKSYSSAEAGEYQHVGQFLDKLGMQKPEIANQLIEESPKELEPFLLNTILGIWKSNRRVMAIAQIRDWICKSKYLEVCAQVFYTEPIEEELLREIFKTASTTKNVKALGYIIGAISRHYPESEHLKQLFVDAIRELTKCNDTWWTTFFWHREKDAIISLLSGEEVDIILDNLMLSKDVDYKIEEILSPIAEKYPCRVIAFFHRRVSESRNREVLQYSAIPFEFHQLDKELSKHPGVVIKKILTWYEEEWVYKWEASRLIQRIFTRFNITLEKELLRLISTGSKEEAKIVLEILRAYEGNAYLHKVCKEFIKKYSKNQGYIQDMFVILSQTGTVVGEYGFVEAYKRKKEDIQSWKVGRDRKVAHFVKEYEDYLDRRIAWEKKRSDERIELDKQRFR